MNNKWRWSYTTAVLLMWAGCSSSEFDMVPATGKVNFTGGSMPQAEIAQIQFVPLPSTNSAEPGQPRPATSDIKPDGSFSLNTSGLGEGAVVGEYKVILRIWRSYADRESLVPSEYEQAETTPLEATVSSESKEFTFDVNLK